MTRGDAGVLDGGGEMGALTRRIDWSRTSLGPVDQWPVSLRTAVGIVLESRFPMLLWWGRDLLQIYNDGYRPILGDKHPASMGAPGAEVWAEIWDILGPMAQGVLDGGPATWSEHLLLPMNRKGFVEETYFTFSYSPVRGDDSTVGGVLVTCQETTEQVLSERRLRTLQALAARGADSKTAEAACAVAAAVLADNQADLPLARIYLGDRAGDAARLVAESGVATRETGCPHEVDVADALGEDAWPLRGGGHAHVLPIARPGEVRPAGLLVTGVSPRLVFDDRYRSFLELVAGQVATAIASARALEEARARAEALAELDRAKTAFFSNVSHEFRTPLTLILGPVEAAVSGGGALEGDALRAVHRNTGRLLKLVNTLLDFARLEAGRVDASFEPTDLAVVTADLASAFRSAIERAGVRFEVACDAGDAPVFVDHDMWEKIVLNLLSNALKFTLEGAIELRLGPTARGVRLTVRDTGCGIPADELPRIFDRFHRVSGAAARTQEGTGIGLALASELVRLHGGTIEVASEVGRGTQFTVELVAGSAHLPAEHVHAARRLPSTALGAEPYVEEALRWTPSAEVTARAATAPWASVEAAADATPGRILVVDDNADMRDYLLRLLEARWTVEVATDGAAALERLAAGGIDLVLSDVMMPGLDGFGLLRAVRADPALRKIPVILLSARAGEESRVEGLEAGADDYVVKPFGARELVARVTTQLQLAALRGVADHERAKLATVFDNAPFVAALLEGPEHRFTFANTRYRESVGDRALVGRPLIEALPELAAQAIPAILDEVRRTGEPFVTDNVPARLERRGRLEDTWWTVLYQPVRDPASGAVESIIVAGFEVTERVQAAAALADASRAKDDFLAMLGHELRNPLAPIVTSLEVLAARAGDVGRAERAVIERQVGHMTRLVDDLLDIARITRGKIELQRERLDVGAAIADALEVARPLIDQRRHRVTVERPIGLWVDGDRARLTQAVANLITNAAKYTEPGGTIAVVAAREDDRIQIRVRDSGAGIAPAMLGRIFDAFVQDPQALDRAQGGLGLGLTIVRSMVALHGGTVSADSAGPGRGSEFTIELPAAEPPEVAPTRASAIAAAAGGPMRILVVDDNVDAAEMLAAVLSLRGHDVLVAHDGPGAIDLAGRFRPALIFLDLGLPVMDGYEVGARLRDDLAGVRIVALTGYGQERDRDRTRSAGFDRHMVKPVGVDEVLAAVSELGAAS